MEQFGILAGQREILYVSYSGFGITLSYSLGLIFDSLYPPKIPMIMIDAVVVFIDSLKGY